MSIPSSSSEYRYAMRERYAASAHEGLVPAWISIPLSVVSDGKTAIVLDTVSGRKLGEGLDAIPSKDQVCEQLNNLDLQPFPESKRKRESLIFRSYDSMNVNVGRKLTSD